MLSHKNVLAQCAQLKGVAIPEKKYQLACLPLFHSKYRGVIRIYQLLLTANTVLFS